MREAVGEVQCRYCDEGTLCQVRKNEKGKLYLYCRECGIHHLNTQAGQDWILKNATLYGPEGAPPGRIVIPKPKPAPAPALKPSTVASEAEDEQEEEDEF